MEEKKQANVNVSLWQDAKSMIMSSHSSGLTKEQVELFNSLKVGDRLIIFPNNKRTQDNHPHFNLLKSNQRGK